VEILGLIFGGITCAVGVGTKLVSALRNYDRQIGILREEMTLDRIKAIEQRSKISADLIEIKSWINLQSSIASSPRYRSTSTPIE
jgi:hypothetical protein